MILLLCGFRVSTGGYWRAYGFLSGGKKESDEKMEANKEVVLKYVQAFNERDEETLVQLFTPDAIIYGVLGFGEMDVALPIWRELAAAFDLKLQVDSVITEGDLVAVRYTERGTSIGEFRGQASTGKSCETVAIEWFEMKAGKIHRRWGARDSATQARQMGLKLN